MNQGDSLGPYRVLDKLGEGGMGEVYRARDSQLNREVAIKVLPQLFAADAERLARFTREAQTLASLNHPNIAQIYGLEGTGSGTRALVMELVDGEDLSAIIARGPVPVADVLSIARQIAEALEAAHGHGIIHRDLKPANVKVRPDGTVKVLDFGLAKALAPGGAGSSAGDLMKSPTFTAAPTQLGMIIGTAAYMAPEQAKGKPVDKRADIWAFGVVLYEMVTGRRLFDGETVSDVLAAVLRADIDWQSIPASVPSDLRRLIARCLEREPKNRLHDIADARIVIDETLRGGQAVETATAPAQRKPTWVAALPWAVAAIAVVTALALSLKPRSVPPSETRPASTFGILVPADHFLSPSQSPIISVSADGRTLLFVAEGKGGAAIFRRTFDRMAVTPVEGTGSAEHPLLSPDGRWIAFFSGGLLRKVSVEGGAAVSVAQALAPRGASWAPDGSLIFSPLYTGGLLRVAASGGTPVAVTKLTDLKVERSHRWPQVLPDGRTVIFTVGLSDSPGDYDASNIDAQRLDTGERRTILKGARMARYTALGYLVYQRDKTLLAVRFDPARLEVTGEPFTIQEGVGGDPSSGAGYFGVSDTGIVAVAPEAAIPKSRVLVMVDQAGRETPITSPPASFNHPRVSPDGRWLGFAIGTGTGGDDDVYVLELSTQRMQRLTFGQGHGLPFWSPDGRHITYTKGKSGATGIWTRPANGSGAEVPLVTSTDFIVGDSWHPDGRRLAVTNTQRSIDIAILDTGAGGTVTPLFARPEAGESAAAFSPDGRYIAYTSTETGTDEVIVETFPPGGGKWQISVDGGINPVWARDGRALYFVAGESLMAVDVDTRSVFSPGAPRVLVTGPYELRTVIQRNYDVGPDGRFVIVKRQLTSSAPREIVVLEGWNAADPSRAPKR
jgi:serine/threonine protein kinase/Tol biopolymer transport system component